MKAAVCYAFNEPLSIEDVEIDPPQRGEVRVRLSATAICHSDIHYIRGERDAQPPLVVGHEAAGTVVEVGEGVNLARPGDEVIVSLLRSCGRCFFCLQGQPYHCEGSFALSSESRLRNARGEPLGDGGLGVSAFAEEAIVDQSQVVAIPVGMPMDRAALLACGLGAVVNTARIRPSSNVAVIGIGGVGLNAVQGAALAGAPRIIALDTRDSKLEAARTFGATHVLNVRRGDPVREVRALTEGRGADAVFVTAGSAGAAQQGLAMTRTAGTLVLVGLPAPGVTLPIVIRDIGWSGQRILGSCMGSTRLAVDVPWLGDLYRQGRLKLDELISGRYPLERINEAIEDVERGDALRNVIVFP